jgi:transcription termination factor Rho
MPEMSAMEASDEIGTPALRSAPTLDLPPQLAVDDLHLLTTPGLLGRAREFNLRINPERTRHQIIFDLLRFYADRGVTILADGILEMTSESHGFLRWPRCNFRPGPEDAYVAAGYIKRYGLQNGNRVVGRLRAPRDREKFITLDEIQAIEGIPVESWSPPKNFDSLTAMFPNERIVLESTFTHSLSARAVDLITPLGRGQRALIVSPPRAGKTILLKEIAQAIRASSPESHVIMLLVDERPEEVTDLKRSVDADIFSSTFDESPSRHIQVAELVSDRAKRIVEMKKHVVILLDSITRLARGYNALQPSKGRTMSGGVESKALMKPKKFFSSARNIEEGGSLTIIATALVETESRMDELIFEEFKGTGNMELHLDRGLAEKRIFPAIHILNSGTRREELLYHPDEFARVAILRRQLAELPIYEAMEVLLENLKATKTNAELLLAGLREVRT